MNLKNYSLGVLWFVLHLFCSATNDVISKYVSFNLNSFEVSFFRFVFSAIALLPFILLKGYAHLKTSHIAIHFIRAVLLFLGISAWTYGLSISHVATATVISFAIPIFTLLMSSIFLEEEVIWQR
jgi:S-adenosylmethionine uptake transporter